MQNYAYCKLMGNRIRVGFIDLKKMGLDKGSVSKDNAVLNV